MKDVERILFRTPQSSYIAIADVDILDALDKVNGFPNLTGEDPPPTTTEIEDANKRLKNQ